MNPEDIKIGQKHTLTLLAIDKERCRRPALFETPTGKKYYISPEDFESVSPENGTKNTEPAPKYDPCRKFRKGDKVRVVDKKNGRTPPCCGNIEAGELYIVSDDEDGGDVMLAVNGKYDCINWYWLELVTPVEELEPYFVMELKGAYGVYNTRFQPETEACHFFTDMHPHAKEAAEAECARLNAEHRKELGK